MIQFISNTQEELRKLNIQESQTYMIEYLDRDYFNGDETLVKTKAKAVINDGSIYFVITDDYGMDKFIKNFRVIV